MSLPSVPEVVAELQRSLRVHDGLGGGNVMELILQLHHTNLSQWDLEDEARFRHGLVLVLHRVGDGVQVRLVAPVVVVAEEEGDDAR